VSPGFADGRALRPSADPGGHRATGSSGSARVMEPSNGRSQLSMKERGSLIWQSAAQLVEDALSKHWETTCCSLIDTTPASSSPSGCER
jgi:hypothetical protein